MRLISTTRKNTQVRFDSRVFSFIQRQNDRLNKNESAVTGRHIYCNIRMFASLHFHGYIRNKLQDARGPLNVVVPAVVRLKVAGSTPPGDTDPVSGLKLPLAATTNHDKPVRNQNISRSFLGSFSLQTRRDHSAQGPPTK